MDRQLDSAKTQLFAEQRRAREKLESMQEVYIYKLYSILTRVATQSHNMRLFKSLIRYVYTENIQNDDTMWVGLYVHLWALQSGIFTYLHNRSLAFPQKVSI